MCKYEFVEVSPELFSWSKEKYLPKIVEDYARKGYKLVQVLASHYNDKGIPCYFQAIFEKEEVEEKIVQQLQTEENLPVILEKENSKNLFKKLIIFLSN